MNDGKIRRLKRIFNDISGKTVIVPMDHGATMGPIPGLEDVAGAAAAIKKGGADATVVHKGIATSTPIGTDAGLGLILHLSASTCLGPDPSGKMLVGDVEEALALGADAVSVHVNIGAREEAGMLSALGRTAKACTRWGMPLLAMMYPRGQGVEVNVASVCIAARVGAELGADLIKCPYTGDPESFSRVVAGCPVPVVIAGGTMTSDGTALKRIEGAMQAGARGLSMGRSAFQHSVPELFVAAARAIVHDGLSAEEALAIIHGQTPGGLPREASMAN
ncbi:2-amino-3,7-dideoxy-D-threo-hept-6-ulosonate synthase [Desulfoluna butyratoxydans]|uniref:2-amino-3,7-dideoxy-D-threo-hept-6-ulosonate synthase n=1 Tax=Desulfoluna butyratoxydans TaxID=231438 RepID=A0A4U8YW84_9BACT|nr:2-amino-3,7-dideoxy-D-threo-hept-6-ulosonate synthase [Desulfoluna butyratoxydans]VFQ46262.1 2-amino-3 7-dideoxy-d-threo-hept-6-ulosonate synthase [Desulfoluna butyratoxydans]